MSATIKTEVIGPVQTDGEGRCSPIDIEAGKLTSHGGILKTVEVDVASESGHS